MKRLKKTGLLFTLVVFLIIPITSYSATTKVTDETMQSDIYYTLTFNANTSDSVENLPPSIDVAVGETITIPEQTPIRTGYTFAGWNTYSDGSGTQYGPGDILVGLNQDSTLYAQWTQNQNNLIFDSNTIDDVDNLPEDISYIPGETVTVPNQLPTRDNYTFVGWNALPDGTGASYQPGDSFTAPESNLTLYAQWEQDNNPIIIIFIVGMLLFIFIISIILLLCYTDYNCDCKK